MDSTLAMALGWGIAAVALFSYLGVAAWAGARQGEREAYYRSEAIKKVAEMQGATPEPVLALLREALKPPAPPPGVLMGPAQARAFYRSETLKRVAELKGGEADAVLTVMREEEQRAARRVREGLKLGGLIAAGVGVALVIFLHGIVPDMPVYLAGLFPLSVGAAMLLYVFVFAPGIEG
jgi:hypothetical protein